MTNATHLKRPAWLLVLTLPAYIAYVVLAVTTLATETDSSSAELTPTQLSDLGVAWVGLHVLWIVPPVLAAIALFQIARAFGVRGAGAVSVLAGVTVVLGSAYLVPQVLAFGFDGTTWGDSSLYPIGVGLSLAAAWAGALPATIIVAFGLARRGIRTKTAWTVTVVTGIYFALELLTYLPALIGSATLAETTGPPPFLLGFLWAFLGFNLLRAGALQRHVGQADIDTSQAPASMRRRHS
jgi:hypothetical protein